MAASRWQIPVDFIHVACDWRSSGYNLPLTGGHSGTICMRLAARRVHFLLALAASTLQTRQFLKARSQNNWLNKKNEDAI